MSSLSLIRFVFVILLLGGCQGKEYEQQYYDDGKTKLKVELKDGKWDGVLLAYYQDGSLKTKEHYKNGQMDGPFEDYYSTGKLKTKGHLQNSKMTKLTRYYENGTISESVHFDAEGDIISAEKYLEDGSRYKKAYSYLYLFDGDTVKIGRQAILKASILNVVDSMYRNGQLIITSGFDTLKNNQLAPRDTLNIVHPFDGLYFEYTFMPKVKGENNIYGMFIYRKDEGDEMLITTEKFVYPYYVID